MAFVDTNEHPRLLNTICKKTYGRSAASMPERMLRKVVDDNAYDLLRNTLRRALGGETMVFEYELRDRGPYRYGGVSYPP